MSKNTGSSIFTRNNSIYLSNVDCEKENCDKRWYKSVKFNISSTEFVYIFLCKGHHKNVLKGLEKMKNHPKIKTEQDKLNIVKKFLKSKVNPND
jgi:hypothetical protein